MKTSRLVAPIALGCSMLSASAANLDITITNLTQGLYLTPFIVGAHNNQVDLFEVGTMASSELQAMAEGGDISGLSTQLTAVSADVVENPASGLLAPAASTNFQLTNMTGNDYLSLTAMLLPTNDGFVGLDSWMIPSTPGTYTLYLNAYDAGTEANDEIVNGGGAPGTPGIPAAPGMDAGGNGTGVTASELNSTVHIHRGNLGDDDLNAGTSDLDNRVHRWLNPVVKVTVVVQ